MLLAGCDYGFVIPASHCAEYIGNICREVVFHHVLGNCRNGCALLHLRNFFAAQDISRLLTEKGKEGKIVARLKGGDPFVFGRGGEEIEVLRAAGVDFEEVPGVTSAIAAPAYAGIPVTHRKVAASFAVITGHEDPTKDHSDIHWEKLAGAVDTLVFLMGVGRTQHIAAVSYTHLTLPTT